MRSVAPGAPRTPTLNGGGVEFRMFDVFDRKGEQPGRLPMSCEHKLFVNLSSRAPVETQQ